MASPDADGERTRVSVRRDADGGLLLRLPSGDVVFYDAADNELTARASGEVVRRDAAGNELAVRVTGEVARRDAGGGERVLRVDGEVALRSPDGWGWIWRRATDEAVVVPLDGAVRIWQTASDGYPRAVVNRLLTIRDDLLAAAVDLLAAADDLLLRAERD